MNHRLIVAKTEDYKKCIKYLMEKNFIDIGKICDECVGFSMELRKNKEILRWRCRNCYKTKSVLKETILENSNINLCSLLDLIYFWSIDATQSRCLVECNTKSRKTVHKWYKILSLQTFYIMREFRIRKIGGVGHFIEVDESKFSKRKNEVGRIVESKWIIGGVDIHTGELFFREVINRNEETISNVLLENIEIGSTIITDCWPAYINISSLGFNHLTVNHSENFIDPNTGANTQAIENRWSIFKRKFKARYIGSNSDFTCLFSEFMFKLKYKNCVFEEFMKNLRNFN